MSETVSYEAKLKSFYGTGRRKHSVARVRLYPGSGNVTINGRGIDDYFGLETLKLIVRQPLELTETAAQFDIVCTVAGGGVTGQAGAIRHGVSRALLQFNAELRPALKKAGFLTRDPRMKERKKYGLKAARRAPQFSKRKQRDNQSRMGLFIKNNEKPRKHCVCEVFFLPEKRAENCSKTDGSTHTAPIQHPLIY